MCLKTWSVNVVLLLILSLGIGCSPEFPETCRRIAIESAGVYCFEKSRVLIVDVGPGGPRGSAFFVEISPPVNPSGGFDGTSKIILTGDFDSSTEPRCRGEKGGGTSCAISVPGKMLKVVVFSRLATEARIAEQTKIVAKEIGETDSVIKQWHAR